ncbi:MAG: UDP-N-acetylmuramate dehydrogenase [Ignavibacteriaceae bacterium]|nr:UDP-N-acetylmuramate dehydrogenase [Ignavibacteriaceae bacterium]
MLHKNHSLKKLNTFGVEAKAKLFAEVFSLDELINLLTDEKVDREKILVLGNGSNILFTKDFDGLVIKLSSSDIKIIDETTNTVLIEADAGVIWNDLVKFCVDRNFGGIENLTLIPGTVGAAPIQNIGAYGHELADSFDSLNGIFIKSGDRKTFSKSECRFAYRSSIFKEEFKNKFIISSVRLKVSKSSKPNTSYKGLSDYLSKKEIANPTIKDVSDAVTEIRRSKLPDPAKIGNAGSFFKNPVLSENSFRSLKAEYPDIIKFSSDSGQIKISAGWLIEKCGWRGKRTGDVGTSPDHALIICNFGNATGAEILEFAMRIKEEVANKFGIKLEEEVNIF